eukprot:TRINITY_DN1975_c0_g1_i1.p1 TRINITY_DN1975_c0_g1~~TRINITY_DN1975_c0_g1_i1.p1  ORF type:complete len:1157 (+),score=468.00 TRINITY_DN1975_c0_g1_i1:153-3623(+)
METSQTTSSPPQIDEKPRLARKQSARIDKLVQSFEGFMKPDANPPTLSPSSSSSSPQFNGLSPSSSASSNSFKMSGKKVNSLDNKPKIVGKERSASCVNLSPSSSTSSLSSSTSTTTPSESNPPVNKSTPGSPQWKERRLSEGRNNPNLKSSSIGMQKSNTNSLNSKESVAIPRSAAIKNTMSPSMRNSSFGNPSEIPQFNSASHSLLVSKIANESENATHSNESNQIQSNSSNSPEKSQNSSENGKENSVKEEKKREESNLITEKEREKIRQLTSLVGDARSPNGPRSSSFVLKNRRGDSKIIAVNSNSDKNGSESFETMKKENSFYNSDGSRAVTYRAVDQILHSSRIKLPSGMKDLTPSSSLTSVSSYGLGRRDSNASEYLGEDELIEYRTISEDDNEISMEEAVMVIEKLAMERDHISDNYTKLKEEHDSLQAKFQEMMLLAMNYAKTSKDELIPGFPKEILEFRAELKDKIESEFLKVFPESNKIQFFAKLLVKPGLDLIRSMFAIIRGEELDEICDPLVKVFMSEGEMTRLLQYIINEETGLHSINSHTLFREDSICSKIVTVYFNHIGKKYLLRIIGPTILKMSKRNNAYEVNATKVTPEQRRFNVRKIKKLTLALLARIFDSADHCPPEIRYVLLSVRCALTQSGRTLGTLPGDGPLVYIGSFFFLRFVCPALVLPSIVGIKAPSPRAQRGLILIAKIIQNMSNNVPFGGKEDYMGDFNEILETQRASFLKFLNSLQTGAGGPLGRTTSFMTRRYVTGLDRSTQNNQTETAAPAARIVTELQLRESLDEIVRISKNNLGPLYSHLNSVPDLKKMVQGVLGTKVNVARVQSVQMVSVDDVNNFQQVRMRQPSMSLDQLINMQELWAIQQSVAMATGGNDTLRIQSAKKRSQIPGMADNEEEYSRSSSVSSGSEPTSPTLLSTKDENLSSLKSNLEGNEEKNVTKWASASPKLTEENDNDGDTSSDEEKPEKYRAEMTEEEMKELVAIVDFYASPDSKGNIVRDYRAGTIVPDEPDIFIPPYASSGTATIGRKKKSQMFLKLFNKKSQRNLDAEEQSDESSQEASPRTNEPSPRLGSNLKGSPSSEKVPVDSSEKEEEVPEKKPRKSSIAKKYLSLGRNKKKDRPTVQQGENRSSASPSEIEVKEEAETG